MMQPSSRIISFIKGYERCRLKAYLPTPKDRWTIGWGETGPGIGPGTVWTQEKADSSFVTRLSEFAAGVSSRLKSSTSQNQFDALVSLAYNIGLKGLSDSTLLRLHNAGDYAGAKAQFVRWNKQAGKVLNGLTRRRTEEAEIYGS